MAKLIYRVIAANSALGYGLSREGFERALDGRVDAIVCNTGANHESPYYLCTGTGYFPTSQIKADLTKIVIAAHRIGCPVIIGSAGSGGSDRHIAANQKILTQVFEHLGIANAQVATISSQITPARLWVKFEGGTLLPAGTGIAFDEEKLHASTIVGQMGVHPIISALQGGAQYVIAGRVCDASLFAADMIRQRITPGLAYHAGHTLRCGALACEPASPADTLICEVYDDDTAFFVAGNAERRCTVHSIAAHSLYKTAHPHVQIFPEGALNTERAQFHARDARAAGISGAQLLRPERPLRVTLHGARRVGYRKLSLLRIEPTDIDKIPDDLIVYGRSALQLFKCPSRARENGVVIETTASSVDSAMLLADSLADHLRRFLFPGRMGFAGNIGYPLSPPGLAFRRPNGSFGALIIGATADSKFLEMLRPIETAVLTRIEAVAPQLLAYANHTITTLDTSSPGVVVITVDDNVSRLKARHLEQLARVTSVTQLKPGSHLNLDATDAYEWSLFQELYDEELICNELFPISYYEVSGGIWSLNRVDRPLYTDVTDSNDSAGEDLVGISAIDAAEPRGISLGSQRLINMASIIRTTNCEINRLCFDVFFISAYAYEAALDSNTFSRDAIARFLGLEPARVVGTYFADSCNAIKITVERPVSGGLTERDFYGEQQQAILEEMLIPIYSRVNGTVAF